MQKVVIEKPYQFIPAHRGNWWPSFIQRFRLIDRFLKKGQGLTTYECRGADKLRASLDAGHGIMITPNHARPNDPIVLGFLAREVRTHVFAMASWHLYHQDWFTAFAIKKMGGFSVYREGMDRKAIDTATQILETAERPLIVFPEGGVTRTNDRLQALMDGVAFIARMGAKKRTKHTDGGKVVVHPVALKYLFRGDIQQAADRVLGDIEQRLSWRSRSDLPLMDRITKIGMTLLTLKEIEHQGAPQVGSLRERMSTLIDHLLHPLEIEWLGDGKEGPVIPRVKNLRMKIVPDMVAGELEEKERVRRWRHLADCYLAQQVASYPPDYLSGEDVSIDRILETIERFEEDLTDELRVLGEMHVIIQVDDAIEVDPSRKRSEDGDPLMTMIEARLQGMLDNLAHESHVWTGDHSAEMVTA